MASGYLELFLEQGETFSAGISLDNFNNSNFDLNNYTAKSDIRKSFWSANTSASFNTSIDANNSIVILSLDANTSQNLVSTQYVYDLFVTNNLTGERYKILEGIIHIEPSVTRI